MSVTVSCWDCDWEGPISRTVTEKKNGINVYVVSHQCPECGLSNVQLQ